MVSFDKITNGKGIRLKLSNIYSRDTMEVNEKYIYTEGDTTPLDITIRFRLFGTKKHRIL